MSDHATRTAPHRVAGNGARTPVVVIGAIALVAVIGLFAWNGGGTPDAAEGYGLGGGGGGPSGFDVEAGVGPSAGSASPDTVTDRASDRPTDTVSPPFSPRSLVPTGVAPERKPDGGLRWVVEGHWQQVMAKYQASFPAPGYELTSRERVGGTATIGYDIVPIGSTSSLDAVGTLVVSQYDVQDTQSRVEFWPR